ncbi:MAG: hypothetical protein CMO12_01445 [Thaumarchaeota archaeon]|nr:hypothetical protein [Nitrososphaerota archaeon]
MLIDLNIEGKTVAIFGGGEEAEFKTVKFLDAGAQVVVISKEFTKALQKLGRSEAIDLVGADTNQYKELLRVYRSSVVIVSTGDSVLDSKISAEARSLRQLVCVVDTPHLCDFNMPAIAKIGDIRVAISSGGVSPAMSSLLRKRIERTIKPEDILQVKLQRQVRFMMKKFIESPSLRKKMVYRILGDGEIRTLLRQNQYARAEARAEEMIRSEKSTSSSGA